jgi:hypothetical protein
MVCEDRARKAFVIACEVAGIPRQELTQMVGRDGGPVIGKGLVFQTPIEQCLSEEDDELFSMSFSKLIGDYNAGRSDPERIKRLSASSS